MYLPIVAGGAFLPDAVAIATLLPVAIALPYVGRRKLAQLGLLALAVAAFVGGAADVLPASEAVPRGPW